jgi:FkbM family methyltransferase
MKHKRYFVEIGCNNFNTLLHLADNGWFGAVVEPMVEYLNTLPVHDNVTYLNGVVIAKEAGIFPFYHIPSEVVEKEGLDWWARSLGSLREGHATIKAKGWEHHVREITVQAITFDDLLGLCQVKEIDLLKMDTEGYDLEILRTIDFDKIRPMVIQYEHKLLSEPEQQEAEALLRSQGYKVMIDHDGDLDYRRKPMNTYAILGG